MYIVKLIDRTNNNIHCTTLLDQKENHFMADLYSANKLLVLIFHLNGVKSKLLKKESLNIVVTHRLSSAVVFFCLD